MRTRIAIETLSIEEDGYHIFLEASVNSHPCRMLVDTGASRTVFDKSRASRFIKDAEESLEQHEKLSTGLGTDDLKSYVTTLESFRIGELELKDYEAILIDMEHVNGSYAKLEMPLIDGVLGGDILKEHHAAIDYQKRVIRLTIK